MMNNKQCLHRLLGKIRVISSILGTTSLCLHSLLLVECHTLMIKLTNYYPSKFFVDFQRFKIKMGLGVQESNRKSKATNKGRPKQTSKSVAS